jgi:hypothetical protein
MAAGGLRRLRRKQDTAREHRRDEKPVVRTSHLHRLEFAPGNLLDGGVSQSSRMVAINAELYSGLDALASATIAS